MCAKTVGQVVDRTDRRCGGKTVKIVSWFDQKKRKIVWSQMTTGKKKNVDKKVLSEISKNTCIKIDSSEGMGSLGGDKKTLAKKFYQKYWKIIASKFTAVREWKVGVGRKKLLCCKEGKSLWK